LFFAVANCADWVHTFATSGSLEKEIFTGFTGRGVNTQVKCGMDSPGLTCGPWTQKTSIVADFKARQNWDDTFRSAVAEILKECERTNSCKAVNFDWVAICSSPVDPKNGGGLIRCTEADNGDNVGIVLAYQLVFAYNVAGYSIKLSYSDNYWKANGGIKQVEETMCKELWKMAGHSFFPELNQYLENRAVLQLYDFLITGTDPLEPPCQPEKDCPTEPGNWYGTFDSTNFVASEDCKAQDFGKTAGLGYNIIMGSPMASDDQGYKASPIFKPKGGFETSESLNKLPNGCPVWKWKYPKGFSVQTQYKLNAATDTGSMYSEQSYQQSSSIRVSASTQGNFVGASFGFTASADFQQFSKTVQKQKMVEVRRYQEAPAFVSSVHLFDMEFTDDYLKSLEAAYNNTGDFSAFIETYGTHITTSVTSGARFSQVSRFTMENYESLKSNNQALEVGMKASYEGISGNANAITKKAQEAQKAFEANRETMTIISVGANNAPLDFSKGGEPEYVELAHQFPELLFSTVYPHSKLIQQRWSDIEKAIPHVDQGKFFDYYDKFIKVYCNGFESKCKASSSDPPQPMTLKWAEAVDSDVAGSTDCKICKPVFDPKPVIKIVCTKCKQVSFRAISDFRLMRDTVTISRIQMQCRDFEHGMRRVAALRFVLTDYTNDLELTPIGNWDPDTKWDIDEPIEPADRVMSVQIRAGSDVDFIQFTIKNSNGPSRQVGCGGGGGSDVVPINLVGYRLLDYAGFQDASSRFIRAIQFRKFKTEFKSEHANQLQQSRQHAENQQFYQSLISLGKDIASNETHSSREAGFLASPQNPQAKEDAHGMWGKIENFEEKFQRIEDTVAKIVDVLLKVEHCASASSSPSPSYSRSADEDDRWADRGHPSKRADPSRWR